MNYKQEKIDLIKSIAQENGLTYYEIGQEITGVSASSVEKIFNGRQVNPRTKTLSKILEFLEQKIAGSKGRAQLAPGILDHQKQQTLNQPNMNTNLSNEVLREVKTQTVLLLEMATTVAEIKKKVEFIEDQLTATQK